MFPRNNRIWCKGLVCKSSSVASIQVIWQTRRHNKRILRKGYSVPQDFSWIENYKLYHPAGIYLLNVTNRNTRTSNNVKNINFEHFYARSAHSPIVCYSDSNSLFNVTGMSKILWYTKIETYCKNWCGQRLESKCTPSARNALKPVLRWLKYHVVLSLV